MAFQEIKCKNCGKTLQVDDTELFYLCKYCMHTEGPNPKYDVNKAIDKIKQNPPNFNRDEFECALKEAQKLVQSNSWKKSLVASSTDTHYENIARPADKNQVCNPADYEIVAGKLIKYKGAPTDIRIPDSVTIIGVRAFSELHGLTSVSIPNSVRTIEGSAFSNCTGLTSVSIPSSVTTIKDYAFGNCSRLKIVTLANGLKTIESSVFSNCTNLDSIIIPSSVTTIEKFAFLNCESLKNVTIPNSVTYIGEGSFGGCINLKNIVLPNSVNYIGEVAFEGSGIQSIKLSSNLTYINNHSFKNTNISNIVIPSSVTGIGDYAFYNCQNLTSVTILNDETTIESDTFSYCPNLTTVKASKEWKRKNRDKIECLKNESGCYIATCVYGTYDCPNVWTLRRFRDDVLDNNIFGRAFIKCYYATSPTLVRLFGNTRLFRWFWKNKLDKFVDYLNKKGIKNTKYYDKY